MTQDDEEPDGQQPNEQPHSQWGDDEGILGSLPGGVRWVPVLIFMIIVVGFELLTPDVFSGDAGRLGQWGYLVVLGIVIAAALGLAALARRRRLGGPEQARLLSRAMREGRIPEGADREKWATELPLRLEATRGTRGIVLLRCARVPLVGFVGLVATSGTEVPPGVVLFFAGVTVVGVVLGVRSWREHDSRQERLQALIDQL